MDLLKNLGISYKASYLVQGNQIERCNTSTLLNVSNTSLQVRTDGKDSDIENIIKKYKGNIVFHLPSVNPDLSNLNLVNNVVKKIVSNNLKLVTIDASNLSSDLFEWSTMEEQKKYFLNVVTAIATLASNKIEIGIENLKSNKSNSKFGCNMGQVTDIIVYSRRLLVKDFGFKEDEAEKYIGLSLNVDNIDLDNEKESITNWIEVFNKNIKVIKFKNSKSLSIISDVLKNKKENIILFYETKEDLDEIKDSFNILKSEIQNYITNDNQEQNNKLVKDNKGFSNIIVYTMVVLTIVIIVLMFIIKLK